MNDLQNDVITVTTLFWVKRKTPFIKINGSFSKLDLFNISSPLLA